MELKKEDIIEKIYEMQEEKLYEIIKEKSKEINFKLYKIDAKNINEKNKNEIINKLEENYNIKISEYAKEFYMQGFRDGVNLIIKCFEK